MYCLREERYQRGSKGGRKRKEEVGVQCLCSADSFSHLRVWSDVIENINSLSDFVVSVRSSAIAIFHLKSI